MRSDGVPFREISRDELRLRNGDGVVLDVRTPRISPRVTCRVR